MSYESTQTMLAIMLVVGLVIGTGAGYMLAPKEGDTVTETEIVERVVYKETMWTWIAVLLGGGSAAYDLLQESRFQKWKAYVNAHIDRKGG